MVDKNAQFDGSIPTNYDRFLGPVLFEPYAVDLASRLELDEKANVLELACGTGILTKALTQSLPIASTLVATDLNLPMLEYARSKLADISRIMWLLADATALGFTANSFDAVVCQFGLMFVPDKVAALNCIYKVLRPDGVLLINVWDALTLNSFQRIAHETVTRLFPTDPPEFYEVPFRLCDQKELAGLLRQGGFGDFEFEIVKKPGHSHSARDLAVGLVYGNPLISAIAERATITPAVVASELEQAITKECGSNPVRGNMQAIVVTARCRKTSRLIRLVEAV